jgi:hypothetical protein
MPGIARTLLDRVNRCRGCLATANQALPWGSENAIVCLKRQGWEDWSVTVNRAVMRSLGAGVERGKRVFTTKSEPCRQRPTDLVQRHFRANAPRSLWVVDHPGERRRASPASLSNTPLRHRRVLSAHVGWNVASTLKADILPLQLWMTWPRSGAGGDATGLTPSSRITAEPRLWFTQTESRNSAPLRQGRSEILMM